MQKLTSFIVIGCGSWGTALASHIASIKESSLIYSRNVQVAEEINLHHRNSKYLGDVLLHKGVHATTNFQKIKEADCIILAVPSYALPNILDDLQEFGIRDEVPILIATKGIARDPVQLFSKRIESKFNNPFAFIGGPNFAKEVAKQQFSSATISSSDLYLALRLKIELESEYFEISACSDMITTQIAGIVKNIIAVKSGMLQASGAGENARAWLVTKGLQEIALIAQKMGGKPETLLETAVVGDLILTAYSQTSRNTKFGYEFYKNNFSKKFLANYPILVEGIEAAKLINQLVDISKLDLPIIASVVEKL